MSRAISISQLMAKKFKRIPFLGQWMKSLGNPEPNGSWIVWGESGHGKTTFLLMLAKELTKYGKVAYDTLEEGARLSMQEALRTTEIDTDPSVTKKMIILNRESITELKERLKKKKHPIFVFIDSLQYANLTKVSYMKLLEEHSDVLFIFISHAEGKQPLGNFAKAVRYHSDIKIRVEGYKAFITSRVGGGEPFTIWEEGAKNYWLDIK
jgi:hypothetical protein